MSFAALDLRLPSAPTRQAANAPRKMVWWYYALLDQMIAHPEKTKVDFAREFNVTPACIYIVTGSDTFQAHFQQRVRERAAALDGRILGKLQDVALSSLTHLETALEKKRDSLPVADLTAIADKALVNLGYGPKGSGNSAAVSVNVNAAPQTVIAPVSASDLADARARLRTLEASRLEAAPLGAAQPVVDNLSEREVSLCLPENEESAP